MVLAFSFQLAFVIYIVGGDRQCTMSCVLFADLKMDKWKTAFRPSGLCVCSRAFAH